MNSTDRNRPKSVARILWDRAENSAPATPAKNDDTAKAITL